MIPNLNDNGYRWCYNEIALMGKPSTILVRDAELIVSAYSASARQENLNDSYTFTDACRQVSRDFERLIESSYT